METKPVNSTILRCQKYHFMVNRSRMAAHMDKAGECFPSQQKIAEYLQVSRQAVNKRIKDLLEFRFQGKPVLTLVATGEGVNRRVNRYRIEPVAQLAIFGSGVEAIEEARPWGLSSEPDNQTEGLSSQPDTNYNHITKTNEPEIPPGEKEPGPVLDNADKVLKYFCQQYRETYHVNYSPNYGRDKAMINRKLLDITFENYDRLWGSRQYPRPSLGAVTTWIANKALAIHQERQKQMAVIQKAQEEFKKFDKDAVLADMRRRRTGRSDSAI